MPREKFTPRIVDGQVMDEASFREVRKFMESMEQVTAISDDMRKLIEEKLPEHAHKLPPREVH